MWCQFWRWVPRPFRQKATPGPPVHLGEENGSLPGGATVDSSCGHHPLRDPAEPWETSRWSPLGPETRGRSSTSLLNPTPAATHPLTVTVAPRLLICHKKQVADAVAGVGRSQFGAHEAGGGGGAEGGSPGKGRHTQGGARECRRIKMKKSGQEAVALKEMELSGAGGGERRYLPPGSNWLPCVDMHFFIKGVQSWRPELLFPVT